MRRIDPDLRAWIELSLVPGLGPAALHALLRSFGEPAAILHAAPRHLEQAVPPAIVHAILSEDRREAVQRTCDWLAVQPNTLIALDDPAYPAQLLQIPDPPCVLYATGDPQLLSRPAVAIVGSRSATPQGRRNAREFARALSEAGLTIVSGLALGIDAAAHEGGLQGPGSTIAVMGTGPETIYPAGNRELAKSIAEHGVLITEFAMGMPPLRANFPRRNRLIAGLARGVLVVEAALASGSLITARMAADQGRDVFAIPGSIHSPVARGCHALIRQGAKLVETAQDVLDELGLRQALPLQSASHDISHDNGELLLHMGHDACDIGTLAQRSGLTAETVSAMLLQLELEGRIGSLPDGLFQRMT